MAYEMIVVETPAPGVGLVRINRPDALNALNGQVVDEIFTALEGFDADPATGCMVLTGSDRAFAAGADIRQMADSDVVTMLTGSDFTDWQRLMRVGKPVIAAVSGWALGGGCELMMLCDVVVCSETAQIGQPEINIGVMPGAGGTQRLTRAVGKHLAMDVILTGRFLTAKEALAHGLVSRVVPKEHWYSEALRIAHEMAKKGPIALRLAKEGVLKAFEMPLSEGLEYERKLFYTLFATEDQKEGMRAFVEKRKPTFKGK